MPATRLGRRIKRLREARGWSQSELARQAKLSGPAHVSLLESGARRDPSASTLQRLAKALRVPVAALLE
jgi:transcriptional regulator with XRE-family HTH domain